MPRFAVVFCLLLWGLTILPSSASAEVIQKPEFSLTLPEGWVEVSQDVLERKYEETMRTVPDIVATRFEYGFQQGPDKDYIDVPGLFIDVRVVGRPSVAVLRSYESAALGSEQMSYNVTTHVLSGDFRLVSPAYGDVFMFAKIIPTEQGSVNLTFSTTVADVAQNQPVIEQIFTTVMISPEIEYRERWLDSYWYLGRPSNIVKTSILLVFGCSFLVFRMHQRRSLKSAEGTQQ